MKRDSGADLVSVTEAAQLLDTTEDVVVIMLKNNELQGMVVDEAWYVYRSSLDHSNMPKTAEIARPEGCGICGSSCGSGC